jgi:quinol monooxygenase YgiN
MQPVASGEKMILVSGTVQINPDRRADAIKAALALASASRKEPGCHAYEFSVTLEDENIIRLFEAWESREALTAHFGMPHMAAFNKAIGGVMASPAQFFEYHVGEAIPLAVSRR